MVARELKVGAFVLAGLLLLGLVVLLIGQERNMFAAKVTYRAIFEDVQGLKRGSSVRMGGVDVGTVAAVGYGPNANDPHLYVSLEVVEDEARRIRLDAVASIDSKGLLGDKMITIEPGSSDKPRLMPGGSIPTRQSKELAEALGRLGSITGKAEAILSNLEQTTAAFAEEEVQKNFKSSIESLSVVLKSLSGTEGYLGRLINDPREAQSWSQTVLNLERASAELSGTLADVNETVKRVNEGPGLLHSVLYEEDVANTVEKFGTVADELAVTLRSIRQGNGLARSVLFGDDSSQRVMGNLDAVTGDIRHIVADVRAGKGTLGALLVDPSVYEDLKMLLGNVSRNRALRALVRYSIKKDEAGPPSAPSPALGSSPGPAGQAADGR
ncbi:MAG: MCE family protein [Polyangiaceae bacterium]|nr:MCE family protein [Polyangiaceae bacterium]